MPARVSGSVWVRLVFCYGSKSKNIPFNGISEALGAVKGFYRVLALVKGKITSRCCEFCFYERYFSYFSVKQEHGPQGKKSLLAAMSFILLNHRGELGNAP